MTPELLAHFKDPNNVGELPPPAVTVEVENPICGDILRLSARMEGGRVIDVRYKVLGCTASIAAGSALTGLMLTRGVDGITAADVDTALGGLPNESKHAAVLCADALNALKHHLS